jgi:hypothetical protein
MKKSFCNLTQKWHIQSLLPYSLEMSTWNHARWHMPLVQYLGEEDCDSKASLSFTVRSRQAWVM